ncbi:MAG: HTH-type transcriptional regulator NimR [Luteibacter sp.]|uniref:AraC family transcriptional regulator n=1 Tax=Luteibacter sp. TaxID=1886636 RepID=UPI00137CDF5D|nr:helix-turn-helix transcriptional regulator [Luteibacter sp.]KAF1003076.1 MAG: HTH-type transcriptional regulator NimR [Luteibacter sp.]
MHIVKRFSHAATPHHVVHRHPEGQLFSLDHGLCTFQTEHGTWLMTPGRPCWIPPDIEHGTTTHGPVSGISILLDPLVCAGLPQRANVFQSESLLLTAIARLGSLPPDAIRARHLLPVVLDELAHASIEPLSLPIPRDERLRTMARDIARNPGDARGPEQWSADIDMPRRTLARRFKDETSLTVIEWRRRARIMKAIVELHASTPLRQVARNVGYESVTAFLNAFREVTGTTPRRFAMQRGLPGQTE